MTMVTGEARTSSYELLRFARQNCIHCGVIFYWPEELDQRARDHARSFYCPGCGKSMVYRETEAQRLKRDLERAEARARERLEWLNRERESHAHTERRLRSTKAVVTKTKNRIAAGKCPCCKERFPDLADHIAAAHPGYGG